MKTEKLLQFFELGIYISLGFVFVFGVGFFTCIFILMNQKTN